MRLSLASDLQPCVDIFDALSNPLRLSIFIQIANSESGLTMTALASTMKMNKATVHHALKHLHQAKLIEIVSTVGKDKFYKPISHRIENGFLVIPCGPIQLYFNLEGTFKCLT